MLSSKLKKILAVSGVCAAILPVYSAYAYQRDLREVADFNTDVRPAAEALVKEIRDDHNENHYPMPGSPAYAKLALASVDPNFSGFFEVDDKTNLLKSVEITSVSFKAINLPLGFSNYEATLKLFAKFTPDCTAIETGKDTRKYEILKPTDIFSSLVNNLFKKDLTGREFDPTLYAYADVVFESIFSTNAEMHARCPNFVPHKHWIPS